jgi:hypothetical protein
MTSFFPDLNVWLALSVAGHTRCTDPWNWLIRTPRDCKIDFARYTHIGLLRLLTNSSAVGEQVQTLNGAGSVYGGWREDPRVAFYPEPRDIEEVFRASLSPFAEKAASKQGGDSYLLVHAQGTGSTLVTFDRALYNLARKQPCPAGIPARTDLAAPAIGQPPGVGLRKSAGSAVPPALRVALAPPAIWQPTGAGITRPARN